MFPFEYIFFFHTDHTPFFSSNTSIDKFEITLSNRFDFLHQNPQKRSKQSPSKKLWDRFVRNKDAILGFLTHADIPFDNNEAERDIRMEKIKQKVSGTFRTKEGAPIFCLTRSFIQTAQKQGKPVFHTIEKLIREGTMDLAFIN